MARFLNIRACIAQFLNVHEEITSEVDQFEEREYKE